jgi:hypothetical protein
MTDPGFAIDIAPLFREHDVVEMAAFFDLRSLDEVRAHAASAAPAQCGSNSRCSSRSDRNVGFST